MFFADFAVKKSVTFTPTVTVKEVMRTALISRDRRRERERDRIYGSAY